MRWRPVVWWGWFIVPLAWPVWALVSLPVLWFIRRLEEAWPFDEADHK
jgi:hypothetical protein